MKVRQEEEEDPAEVENFQSLSLYHHPSNSPEHKDTPPRVRVPNTTSDAPKFNTKVAHQNTNKPTSPLLRPRAVLSSPENDVMLGSKHKTKTHHNSHQNRHVKCNKSYELDKKIRSSSWAQ